MRTHIAPEELARDERFTRLTTVERFSDPRATGEERRIDLRLEDVSDRARSLMNGIFVGEIQALEGASRTAFDDAAPGTRGDGDAPLRLARRFRGMAGFSTGEIDDIAAMAAADREACAAVSGEHHAGSSGAGRTSHRTSRALVRRHAFSLGVRWRRTGSSTTT